MAGFSTEHLASEPFKFIVEDTTLYVHSSLVAKLSEPLDRLMNGCMSESINRSAVLNDVAASTFMRFCEWAYTGTYTAPGYDTQQKDDANKVETEKESYTDEYTGLSMPQRKKLKKKFGSSMFGEDFPEAASTELSNEEKIWNAYLKLGEFSKVSLLLPQISHMTNSPSEALQPHAQLYLFADMYRIEPLQNVAARNLHAVLTKLNLNKDSASDISFLIRDLYENTLTKTNGTNMIRNILRHYIGYHMNCFVKSPGFRQLLHKNEDLMNDFLDMVAERTEK